MSLASSSEKTSKKSWYSGGTTLVISSFSLVGRGLACNDVMGSGMFLLEGWQWVLCTVGNGE